MKRKNGFTLVELLAVIVILAIIALIATPLILNVIENARKGASESSALGYIEGIEKYIVLNEFTKENNFSFEKEKGYNVEDIKDIIEIKGDKPKEGWVCIGDKKEVNKAKLKINNYVIKYEDNKAKVVDEEVGEMECTQSVVIFNPCTNCTNFIDSDDSKTISVGDEITFGNQSFNVISNDGTNIKMLSKYNLNVGDNPYGGVATGLQDTNIIGGYTSGYGNVAFSSTSKKGTNFSDYEGSIVEEYVNAYKIKLEELGMSVIDATLITKDELINLGCSEEDKTCKKSSHEWILNTSYWTGSAYDSEKVWYVEGTSSTNTEFQSLLYRSSVDFGVRPVITISNDSI